MNLTSEFKSIREWARERGIFKTGDPKTQALKCVEEMGELAKAIIEDKPKDIQDALGDVVVTLVSVAGHYGWKLEDCINGAYQEIKNRKGKMENGTFIKE